MTLRILFKDRTLKTYKGICRCTNISTNHEVDYLYFETYNDIPGKGESVEFDKILCFEVVV